MDAELFGQRGDADAPGAGCSHSVRFLLSQPCSSASPWLCRRREEWVVGLGHGLDSDPRPSIPRGTKPLNLLSPVPVVVDGAHHEAPGSPGAFRILPRALRRRRPAVSRVWGASTGSASQRASRLARFDRLSDPDGAAQRPRVQRTRNSASLMGQSRAQP